MKNSYFHNGGTYSVTDATRVKLVHELPPAVYSLSVDAMGVWHFQQTDGFELPEKFYGDTERQAARILSSFDARPGTTGALLAGEKGSGKTLLAKLTSVLAMKMGMPVILINAPWKGQAFNDLIAGMDQPAVLLFDEFEKIYDREAQAEMLTLFDGTTKTKKLFLLTVNDKFKVDSFMRNRPGRIYYAIDFVGLPPEFVRDYCADNLEEKSQIEAVVKIASIFSQFNFDMLKALVEEMNRYRESPVAALRMLNVRPQYDDQGEFTIKATSGLPGVSVSNCWPNEFRGNPLTREELTVSIGIKRKKVSAKSKKAAAGVDDLLAEIGKGDDEDDRISLALAQTDIKSMDSDKGEFTYEKAGITVVLRRKVYERLGLESLLV